MSRSTVLVHILPVFPLNHGALPDCSACQPVFPLIHPSLPPEVSRTQGMIKSLPSLNSCPGACKIKGTLPPLDTEDSAIWSHPPLSLVFPPCNYSPVSPKEPTSPKMLCIFTHHCKERPLLYFSAKQIPMRSLIWTFPYSLTPPPPSCRTVSLSVVFLRTLLIPWAILPVISFLHAFLRYWIIAAFHFCIKVEYKAEEMSAE